MSRNSPDSTAVVVCGAGAAGMSAAIAAARQGVPTLLLEAERATGGTVANSLIHTLAGLYDGSGELLNDGLAAELEQRLLAADDRTRRRRMGSVWVLNVAPDVYRRVTRAWLAEEPHLTVLSGTRVTGASADGNNITAVEVESSTGRRKFACSAAIDTTGCGALVRQIAPELWDDDDDRAAGGLIFRLRGVPEGALTFPKGIGVVRGLKQAAQQGILPPSCEHLWIDSGVSADEVYVKLFVPLVGRWSEEARWSATARESLAVRDAVIERLRTIPDFAAIRLEETGTIGVRDGGRARGEIQLTADDVRSGRRFEDAACRAAWPIEYWDAVHGIQLEPLPPGVTYDIPLGALTVAGWSNLWIAGKCLSADHRAQASARVVGTCWSMGEAVGSVAAQLPRKVLARES